LKDQIQDLKLVNRQILFRWNQLKQKRISSINVPSFKKKKRSFKENKLNFAVKIQICNVRKMNLKINEKRKLRLRRIA